MNTKDKLEEFINLNSDRDIPKTSWEYKFLERRMNSNSNTDNCIRLHSGRFKLRGDYLRSLRTKN